MGLNSVSVYGNLSCVHNKVKVGSKLAVILLTKSELKKKAEHKNPNDVTIKTTN